MVLLDVYPRCRAGPVGFFLVIYNYLFANNPDVKTARKRLLLVESLGSVRFTAH